jgi:hypothetical protein
MAKQDPALTISNPRLLAAIYFGLLSVVGTILINALLTLMGYDELIPVFQAIIIGVIVAGATGALFGEQIVHCKKPYKKKVFILGFIMVIASLPFFALGLTICMILENSTGGVPITGILSMLYFYLDVLAYSYVLFGILLAIGSGLAAMYLRGQFVYDILHTYEETSVETQVLPVKVVRKPYHNNRPGKKTA